MLIEISHSQNDKYCMVPHIHEVSRIVNLQKQKECCLLGVGENGTCLMDIEF